MPAVADRAQFSLRTLFYVMFVVAVLVAITAPLLRGWNSQHQVQFLIAAGVQLTLFLIGVYWVGWQRSNVRREAGVCRFRSSFRDRGASSWRSEWKSLAQLLVLLLGQLGMLVLLIQVSRQPLLLVLSQTFYLIQVGPRCVWNLLLGVDAQDVEICEHGVIYGVTNWWPWEAIVDVREATFRDDQLVFVVRDAAAADHGKRAPQITMTVPVHAAVRGAALAAIEAARTRPMPSRGH